MSNKIHVISTDEISISWIIFHDDVNVNFYKFNNIICSIRGGEIAE